ncbi:MAG: arginase [Cellvibrionales bacterium]|nr:arginase [Cellvibrionales bacterium]
MQAKRPIHIINVPLDLGASCQGAFAGPMAFQIAGLNKALQSCGHEISKMTDIEVPDRTRLHPKNSQLKFKKEILDVCRILAETTKLAIKNDCIPLIIGGDHSIAMGSISGIASSLNHTNNRLGVIWFDAHGDMNIPESSPSGNIHGMPLAHLLGKGDQDLSQILEINPAIHPENVVLIGLRDIDEIEKNNIDKSGVTTFTMQDIDRLGMYEVSKRALEIANNGTEGFHLSFDLDGCDPEVIPGTGTRVEGGVNIREAHIFLESCAANGQMTSMDVVELNPFLDHGNISAKRAVSFIESAFGKNIL